MDHAVLRGAAADLASDVRDPRWSSMHGGLHVRCVWRRVALAGTASRFPISQYVSPPRRSLYARRAVEQRVAREGGDLFPARERVFSARHPEITQTVNKTLELLRKAGVVINDVILSQTRMLIDRVGVSVNAAFDTLRLPSPAALTGARGG